MECKNCKTTLKETANFCDECGGKIINHRLNFKTVTAEFFATFISWDNKFFKTFVHLFTKPQEVIDSYISGIRKRYMQPFAYMIIALTIYGVYLHFAKEYFYEIVETSANLFKSNDSTTNEFAEKFGKQWQDFSIKHYNLITFSMIPFFAVINLIIFRKRLNFIEHNIFLLYSYAQCQFLFLIITTIGLLLQINIMSIISLTMILMIGYHMFVFKKLFKQSLWQIIYKTILFFLLLTVLFVIIQIVMVFLLFFTDVLDSFKNTPKDSIISN